MGRRCLVALSEPGGQTRSVRGNLLRSGPGRALVALPAGTVPSELDVLRVEVTWAEHGTLHELDARTTVSRLRHRDLLALDVRNGPVPARVRRHVRGPAELLVAVMGMDADGRPAAHAGTTLDVSGGGLSVSVASPLALGAVNVLVGLPSGEAVLPARVVQCEEQVARLALVAPEDAVAAELAALAFRAAWEDLD